MRRDWVSSCSYNERTNEINVWHSVQEGNYGPIGSYVVSIPYHRPYQNNEIATKIDEDTYSTAEGKIYKRILGTENFQEQR